MTSDSSAWAASGTTAPAYGPRSNTPQTHALVGARVVVEPGRVVENATLVIRDGVIAEVTSGGAAPSGARVWDVKGRTIYPGLIDAFSEVSGGELPATYWNRHVRAELRMADRFRPDDAQNKSWRSQGVTARLVAPSAGIIKGQSAVVTTGDEDTNHQVLRERAALHVKLTPVITENREYPVSPMGAFTLVRQAFYDARWHDRAWKAFQSRPGTPRPEGSAALEALHEFLDAAAPVIVDVPDELYALRAARIGDEFGLNVVLRGSGREYRRLDAIRATGRAVIVPLDFPKVPDVRVPEAAASVPLEKLLHWDLAPENPARLDAAGVRIALTSHGLKETGGFLAAVRKAVKHGLPADRALRALTQTPAALLGLDDRLGTLERGKLAHFVVVDGDLFDAEAKVLETWVDGRRYETAPRAADDARGVWEVALGQPDGSSTAAVVRLTGTPEKLAGAVIQGEQRVKLDHASATRERLQLRFPGDAWGQGGMVRLSARLDVSGEAASWTGTLVWPNEATTTCTARRSGDAATAEAAEKEAAAKSADKQKSADATAKAPAAAEEKAATADSTKDPADLAEKGDKNAKDAKDAAPTKALFDVMFPLGELGVAELPAVGHVLFTRATVWTSGPQGTLHDASVLIADGKVVAVGRELAAPTGATVVDCQGKHLTPGIIDCHSHIATDGGVNESGQAVSAEVRIGDFIDCDDVNIYRQLAGGVTSSNILHGSANPIGGQNQVIKLRWGALPEAMKLAGAPPGIKFALGENVKQANWGDRFTTRYPQTRMGVDELIRDEFRAAQDYRRRWDEWRKDPQGLPPRVDLELEAIAEILEKKRLIHCHSYRQDEILALLRNCADFGIRIATLQHILEGYKVADVMAQQGVGGSSFSDWWAYKYEVLDAIPYNGALMHHAGVLVSFNSDDAELARRLNLEAAKAVKYGGVPEAEALKFVTYNPAQQLGIADRIGSLEPGKDADLVIWNGSPLSGYSRCEQTWVDGRKYFDREEDRARQKQAEARRAALVQRALASKDPVEGAGEGKVDEKTLWPRHDEFCGHGDHDHE